MRQYWLTILMAVIFGGLAAYLYVVELPTERTKAERDAQEARVLPFEEHQIRELTVRSASSEVTLQPTSERRWQITAPIRAEADRREVEALIRALMLGKVSRMIDEKPTNLAPFGLDVPSVILTVRADSQHEMISLGASGPITSTLYALRESDKKVILTNLAPKDFLNKTLMTFRKKEVLDFDHTKVQRIRLTYPQTEFVLYRAENTDKDSWRIRFPIQADADQSEVNGLLFTLRDLKALGFIDQGTGYRAVIKTFNKPKVKVTLRVAGTDRVVKLFEPSPASGQAFAVTGPTAPLYRINPMVIKDLTKNLFAVRDKRLLGTSLEDLAMLQVKTRKEEYVLINQNNTWVLEDQPHEQLNRETVNLFISRVASFPAELQVLKRAGPLAPYGLVSPSVEFVATDRQGETSRLAFGRRIGGLVYAKGNGLPGIYQARADIVDQVPARRALLASPDQTETNGAAS